MVAAQGTAINIWGALPMDSFPQFAYISFKERGQCRIVILQLGTQLLKSSLWKVGDVEWLIYLQFCEFYIGDIKSWSSVLCIHAWRS